MERLLVTGLNGFVGQTIRRLISGDQHPDVDLIEADHRVDIRDAQAIEALISLTRPTRVIHLAAQSFVPEAIRDPKTTFDTNFYGTLNLLQALDDSGFTGSMLYVGSSDEYGLVAPDALPITEQQVLRPRNPYSVSKVAAEALSYQWSQTARFRVVMARPFNHIGPGQDERFVVSSFAKQIAAIKSGLRPNEIAVGDIDVTRDFTDVRDVARAYLLLLEQGQNGEVYNICSGVERSPREILNRMLGIAGIAAGIREDEGRMRRSEQRRAYGSCEKLRMQTSWTPQISLDTSLSDILLSWQNVIDNQVQGRHAQW